MIGAGAVAALTVIGAGMVRFPASATEAAPVAAVDATTRLATEAERPVRYIKLKRGQKAPKGAKVIQKAAPKPRVVIRRVTVSTSTATRSSSTPSASSKVTRPKPQPRTTRTRQSG